MPPTHRTLRIKQPYEPQYPDPLRAAAGDKVSVGREDADFPGWKWCTAEDGRQGWVPVELLSGVGAEANLLEDYSARELAVKVGEVVTVEDARHAWLLVRNAGGERGWIPESHTEDVR
jgi:uncharacterized protein YgiM (DUF1202 family)